MKCYTLTQGHPYSNDNQESWEENVSYPPWMTWGFVIVVGIAIGVWLFKNHPPKKD